MAALAVGGHILGTIAGIQGAMSQAAAAKFEGQVAAANHRATADAFNFNSKVAEQQARNTRQVARAEAMDFRRQQGARLSARRAKMAASGIVSTSGSPLMVDEAILSEIEFGGARITNQGDIVSTRQENEARLLKAQAQNANRNATYALQAGRMASSAAKLGVYSAIAQGAVGVGNTIMSSSAYG